MFRRPFTIAFLAYIFNKKEKNNIPAKLCRNFHIFL